MGCTDEPLITQQQLQLCTLVVLPHQSSYSNMSALFGLYQHDHLLVIIMTTFNMIWHVLEEH